MMEPILSIHGLSVRFGALLAVNDVSFDALAGKITAVIGPNGAGKSSLFNLISGAVTPTRGRVMFENKDVTGTSPDHMLKVGLSRSFQITNLFFELTVQENLRLAAQFLEQGHGLFRPLAASTRANARVDELIVQFGLQDKASELAGYLSHGEQRRLEIAVSLAARPRMLLLDEPTQGMSHADTKETEIMIRGLASRARLEHPPRRARRGPGDEYFGPRCRNAPRKEACRRHTRAGAQQRQRAGRLFWRARLGETMLELRDVHSHYGLSHVLQGIHLRVEPGEVVGLFGRNGVGKTTVIKTIAGWVQPTRGEIVFESRILSTMSADRSLPARDRAWCRRIRRIFPGLTVEENLRLGFRCSVSARSGARQSKNASSTRSTSAFRRLAERRAPDGDHAVGRRTADAGDRARAGRCARGAAADRRAHRRDWRR
jgi:branched-chain amino acid transport system ATP-binding protein